jgi:hypothetical protein
MHCLLLVTFGIVARISRYADRFGDLRMGEIPMTSLSATIRKARSFEVSDQLSHFPRHGSRLQTGVRRVNA